LNRPVTTRQVATYTCPTDSPSASPNIFSGVTFHNYTANHGNTHLQQARAQPNPYGTTTTGQPNIFGGAPFIMVDSWSTNPQVVRLQDVLDGLSNTLMFSETVQGKQNDLRGFAWWNGGAHFETYLPPNSSQPDSVESNCVPPSQNPLNPPCVVFTSLTNPRQHAARSRHPGGVQASMCDGSVRFVSNSIHLDTWRWSSTSSGKDNPGEL
jgi:prepilin-type processing-associated H-X9-DG protein